jgi:GT2 family glycosyltransferase
LSEEDRQPLVSVVLLSYNRPEFLDQALQSVAAQTYPNLEIIVVDNPSPNTDAIRAMVARYPKMRLVVMPHNSGYTGGMNEGIRQAKGEYIYLTEEDMVSDSGCVAAMVAYAETDPQAAIISGIHYDEHGAMVHAGGFLKLGTVYSLFLIGRDTPEPPPMLGPFCATYITGAMLMLRRSAVQELGAFAPDFFMYVEDVELCVRYLRAGRTIVIVPAAQAKTLANLPALKSSALINFHKFKNLQSLYIRHAPARVLPGFFARYAGVSLLRHLFRDPAAAVTHLRANLWVIAHLPQLLRERKRLSAMARGPRATPRLL